MADLAKTFDLESLNADLLVENAGFAESASLVSAVVNSLFSDARAPAGLLAYMAARDGVDVSTIDPRGWPLEQFTAANDNATPRVRYGSLLWTLQREKQTQATLNRAISYAREALDWMTDDGIARDISIEGEWIARGRLALAVTIGLSDGRRRELHFNDALRTI